MSTEDGVFEADCANALQQLSNLIIDENSSDETKKQAALLTMAVGAIMEAAEQRFAIYIFNIYYYLIIIFIIVVFLRKRRNLF
jgi:hypothetical protein